MRIYATRHRWKVQTDTGWQFRWWALTHRGLVAAVRHALYACGMDLDRRVVEAIVERAQQAKWVEVAHG
jgi:hypothetical protein